MDNLKQDYYVVMRISLADKSDYMYVGYSPSVDLAYDCKKFLEESASDIDNKLYKYKVITVSKKQLKLIKERDYISDIIDVETPDGEMIAMPDEYLDFIYENLNPVVDDIYNSLENLVKYLKYYDDPKINDFRKQAKKIFKELKKCTDEGDDSAFCNLNYYKLMRDSNLL